ncbi:50S ribosomal protein L25/general stress protein Ctc [Metallibacterium scheffleri]|uniref:Large ribosomal subunit protein bL25 n=1 Tax=Metallibacterium scheffleri TaxID=993689 RepID=A0A4V3USM3_9GAMM|nr:50S ribosomal protein L25/general stress protein Ctc [Metallibacterium scheffleri]THD07301.1 50S ribosomal protein L25/general stress protein Ctc [Metallibacterium scheffleri]
MASKHEIKAQIRKDEGKGASRRLRHADFVPAVIYGGTQPPQSLQLIHNDVALAARNEWFFSALLDLNIEGKVQKVLLRDLQRHPVKSRVLHLDFQRIDESKPIRLKVPLHFLNQDKSPAGKIAGLLIMHEVNEVEISCLPSQLPEHIEVDLSTLEKGDIVHLSSIKLPEGVQIPALRLGKEHDLAAVVVKEARVEVEEETAAPEAAAEVPATAVKAEPAKTDAATKAEPGKGKK